MSTPFADDDLVDQDALRTETAYMIEAGVNGIVVAGSTGEGAGMSEDEIYTIVSVVVEAAENRIPVLCGIIADNSREAVRLALAARRGGAVGLQVPPPHFYFSTSTKILTRYYRDIADGAGLPLIVYNVIPWAQVAIDAIEEIIAGNPAIVGIKQSGLNFHALADLLSVLKGKTKIFSAIDDLIYPSFMLGADGTISGTSSVFPRETVELYHCVREGNLSRALALHRSMLPVWRILETPDFPGRLKCVLTMLGRSAGKARGPFNSLPRPIMDKIAEALRQSRGAALAMQ